MLKTPLAVALVLGVGWGAATAQDAREKSGAGSPERRLPPPAAAQGRSGEVSSMARQDSASPGRGRLESRARPYAESLMKQWDKNKNGVLEKEEWSQMAPRWRAADLNGDGKITLDELTAYVARLTAGMSPGPMPPGISPAFDSAPPPPESRGGGSSPSTASRILETLGMSAKPLDSRAATVEMRLLIAESVADAGPKPPPSAAPSTGGGKLRIASPKTPAAKPTASPSDKQEGLVEIDLTAPREKIQEELAKIGIRGRWESVRRVQLAAADRQGAFVDIGGSQPQIHAVHISQYGRTHSVQYLNAGSIIGVQPQVDPGGIISVDVDVKSSRIGSDDEGVPMSKLPSGETIASHPIHSIVSRSIVRVPDGKTVVVARMGSVEGGRHRDLIILLSAQVTKSKAN
jgi:hypothetical protein